MNRYDFDGRDRHWSPRAREQGGREAGRNPSMQGGFTMQAGYDDPRRGYDEGYWSQPGAVQPSYGPEGAWTGGYDFDERFRYQDDYDRQWRQEGQNFPRFRQQSGQGYGPPMGEPRRAIGRGDAEDGPWGRIGIEGRGQPAYRGGGDEFPGRFAGQGWREGNQRAQGYPGTDYYSGRDMDPFGDGGMMRGAGGPPWSVGTGGGWQGPHTGKGPRGYQRADERIREDVCELLSRHGGVDASEIDVEVRGGDVTLRGMVADRFQKRLAEDLVESCSGVNDVRNELRLSQSTAGQHAGASGATATSGTPGATPAAAGTSGRVNETTAARSR